MRTTIVACGAGIILGLVAVPVTSVISQDSREAWYGIYSNMQAVDGEYSGFEFIIVPSTQGDFVVFQEAEGWPEKPLLLAARLGASTPTDNNAVRFEHPEWGPFKGVVSGDSLAGEFTQAKHQITLRRGQSIWQR